MSIPSSSSLTRSGVCECVSVCVCRGEEGRERMNNINRDIKRKFNIKLHCRTNA